MTARLKAVLQTFNDSPPEGGTTNFFLVPKPGLGNEKG